MAPKIASSLLDRAPYSQLALELIMSPSEVHASVQRAQAARLLHGPGLKNRPNFAALEEFLVHGLKYAFPVERGTLTRGVPTSYAAEPLRRLVAQGNEPAPVWPSEEGTQRGIAFEPLYRSAPLAAPARPSVLRIPGARRCAARRPRSRKRACRGRVAPTIPASRCPAPILNS